MVRNDDKNENTFFPLFTMPAFSPGSTSLLQSQFFYISPLTKQHGGAGSYGQYITALCCSFLLTLLSSSSMRSPGAAVPVRTPCSKMGSLWLLFCHGLLNWYTLSTVWVPTPSLLLSMGRRCPSQRPVGPPPPSPPLLPSSLTLVFTGLFLTVFFPTLTLHPAGVALFPFLTVLSLRHQQLR